MYIVLPLRRLVPRFLRHACLLLFDIQIASENSGSVLLAPVTPRNSFNRDCFEFVIQCVILHSQVLSIVPRSFSTFAPTDVLLARLFALIQLVRSWTNKSNLS